MIKHHEKFLFGEEGQHHFYMEVNWRPMDEKTNDCKILKVTFPDGTETFVKREHFHSFLFAISAADQQVKLVPYKQETIRNIETTLGITATKDIKKGDKINVRVKIPIPIAHQETIGIVPAANPNQIIS